VIVIVREKEEGEEMNGDIWKGMERKGMM